MRMMKISFLSISGNFGVRSSGLKKPFQTECKCYIYRRTS